MRIISGTARGTKLYTLEGLATRPTLDRVKESFFNIIQNDLQDKVFLDLFAGSGAIGLEAASRGTKKTILCDKSKNSIQIINKNIEKTHLKDKVKVYNSDFQKLLNDIIKENLDYIYIDPPYESNYIEKSLKLILENNLIDENSKIIVETDDEKRIITQIQNIKNINIVDRRKYGRAVLIFIELKSNINLKGEE